MKENTNRAIFINSIISYARIGINAILSLFITRFALKALGVMDYGLFSVLGSIISFIAVFNTIMTSTCNRFITVAIGKGDSNEINKAFNVNLTIFLLCALLLLIISYPIGQWYITFHINYDGPTENAMIVLVFSIIGSVFSTLATPFNGLLIAKERFFMFSICDVLMHIVRFFIVWLLIYYFQKKLLIYSILMSSTSVAPSIIYWLYCRLKFPEIVKWNFCRDKSYYKEVVYFSGWVSYGAIAVVVRNQAAALIVNNFFNTVVNAALGVANSLNHYVTLFANTITQPMQPQITKSYVKGNNDRTDELLIMSTKFSFMAMMLIGAPFFVASDWIIHFWLGQVPPYASSFTLLLIIDNIVLSFNSGLSVLLFASGKIALYQFTVNTLRILSVLTAYFILKTGVEPYVLFVVYIVFSGMVVVATQSCLHKELNYNIGKLMKNSYLPSLRVLGLFLPIPFLCAELHPLGRISIAVIYLMIIEFILGLTKTEKKHILNKIKIKKNHEL